MLRAEVIDYEIWNTPMGFEVNNMYRWGEVEIKSTERKDVIHSLRDAGYLVPHADPRSFQVDDWGDSHVEITHLRTGTPLCGLRLLDWRDTTNDDHARLYHTGEDKWT